MIPRIYIAGPYTAPTRREREAHVARARQVARAVHRLGVAIVCPHISGIEMEDVRPDLDWTWWMEATSQDLETCHAVVVVDGWEGSTGTCQEIKQAARDDQPVFYADSDGNPPEGLAQFIEDWWYR